MNNLQLNQRISTLFPTTGEIERMENFEGPSNPVPGSEWQVRNINHPCPVTYKLHLNDKSSLYFDAVKLNAALTEIAHDAQARQWKLEIALRNVRLAETEHQRIEANSALEQLYTRYINSADTELKVRMAVNELANTIDPDERPHSGRILLPPDRYYAYRPVWEFIKKIRQAFKRSDS